MTQPANKTDIITAAVQLALSVGYQRITRDAVARSAGVAVGTINSNFGTIEGLRREVLKYAVKGEILPIIAQGLAVGAHETKDTPDDLKQRALAAVA